MTDIFTVLVFAAIAIGLRAWYRSMKRRERQRWITDDAWQDLQRRARAAR